MEFMAKFGPLRLGFFFVDILLKELFENKYFRQFDHYGQQLNFFQYYLIDVFVFLISIVILALFSLLFCLLSVAKRVVRKSKIE